MVSRLTLLVLTSLIAGIPPASAAPILAEFSRTAFARVDDGDASNGGPYEAQAVNNFDFTPNLMVFLDDPVPSFPDSVAQAFSIVNFGHIRIHAVAESREPQQTTATASGGYQDVMDIAGAGTAGGRYRFSGSFRIAGSAVAVSDGGLSNTNIQYAWNAHQDDPGTSEIDYGIVGTGADGFVQSSNGFIEGTDFLGTVIPVEFDFVWGLPVIFEISVGTGAAAHRLDGLSATAFVDLSHSLEWLGASVVSLDGSGIDASIQGRSGTDWTQAAAVPEPGAVALVGIGLSLVAFRRIRR